MTVTKEKNQNKKNTSYIIPFIESSRTKLVALMVKNLPASSEDITTVGSIPGQGRSRGEGHATHSSILAWRIPWTEEPGRL